MAVLKGSRLRKPSGSPRGPAASNDVWPSRPECRATARARRFPPGHIWNGDAIVVLAAGGASSSGALSDNSLRRAIYGIDLYLKGLAPLLVFSGNDPDASRAESRIRAHMAQEFGVSPQGVLTSSGANTTREEAAHVKGLLWPRGVRNILLVTDADHMIRAAPVFTHAGFRVFAVPVNEPEWDLGPGDRLDLLRGTLREIVALLYYKIAGYL